VASFNFQRRFIDPIARGTKGGTIRAYRRFPQKVGEPMHLFHGLRQVKPALLIIDPAPVCVALMSIFMTKRHRVWISPRIRVPRSVISCHKSRWDLVELQPDERERLAIFDGFESFEEMMSFWDGRLPFLGHWQCWLEPPVRVLAPMRRATA